MRKLLLSAFPLLFGCYASQEVTIADVDAEPTLDASVDARGDSTLDADGDLACDEVFVTDVLGTGCFDQRISMIPGSERTGSGTFGNLIVLVDRGPPQCGVATPRVFAGLLDWDGVTPQRLEVPNARYVGARISPTRVLLAGEREILEVSDRNHTEIQVLRRQELSETCEMIPLASEELDGEPVFFYRRFDCESSSALVDPFGAVESLDETWIDSSSEAGTLAWLSEFEGVRRINWRDGESSGHFLVRDNASHVHVWPNGTLTVVSEDEAPDGQLVFRRYSRDGVMLNEERGRLHGGDDHVSLDLSVIQSPFGLATARLTRDRGGEGELSVVIGFLSAEDSFRIDTIVPVVERSPRGHPAELVLAQSPDWLAFAVTGTASVHYRMCSEPWATTD